jgi:hypothetical protein
MYLDSTDDIVPKLTVSFPSHCLSMQNANGPNIVDVVVELGRVMKDQNSVTSGCKSITRWLEMPRQNVAFGDARLPYPRPIRSTSWVSSCLVSTYPQLWASSSHSGMASRCQMASIFV